MPSTAPATNTHRPCLALAAVLASGMAMGKFLPIPAWIWLGPAAAGLGFSLKFSRLPGLYVALLCLGAASMAQQQRVPPESLVFLSHRQRAVVTAVEGVVDSAPVARGGRRTYLLRVERIWTARQPRPAAGMVQVNVYSGEVPAYGDRCRIQGKLVPFLDLGGKDGFSYRRYMQDHGVYWMMRVSQPGQCRLIASGQGNPAVAGALKVRAWIKDLFLRYLAPSEAGFTAALVMGEHNALPHELKQVFINTGTAHVLAISGMNMAVVTAVAFFVLGTCGLPRVGRYCGTIGILFVYMFISGWSPSVVRAGLMSMIVLAAFAFEQEGEALNSLGLAALILLAADPGNLCDVGFQLSFAAVAAILIFFEPVKAMCRGLPEFLASSLAVSLAAWAGTAPVIFYHFHMVTPVSILANIPIVPLADMVMVLGLGLAATGGWCPWLGYACAAILKCVLSAMTICAVWCDAVPYGHFGP